MPKIVDGDGVKGTGLTIKRFEPGAVYIPRESLTTVKAILESLHRAGGGDFHLTFNVGSDGQVGDAHFRILNPPDHLGDV